MYWRGLQSGLIVHQSVSIAQKLAVRLLDKLEQLFQFLYLQIPSLMNNICSKGN